MAVKTDCDKNVKSIPKITTFAALYRDSFGYI